MDIFDVVEELVHLRFAVACGFADDQVGKVRKGEVFAYGKSVGAFNISGQMFFGRCSSAAASAVIVDLG